MTIFAVLAVPLFVVSALVELGGLVLVCIAGAVLYRRARGPGRPADHPG